MLGWVLIGLVLVGLGLAAVWLAGVVSDAFGDSKRAGCGMLLLIVGAILLGLLALGLVVELVRWLGAVVAGIGAAISGVVHSINWALCGLCCLLPLGLYGVGLLCARRRGSDGPVYVVMPDGTVEKPKRTAGEKPKRGGSPPVGPDGEFTQPVDDDGPA